LTPTFVSKQVNPLGPSHELRPSGQHFSKPDFDKAPYNSNPDNLAKFQRDLNNFDDLAGRKFNEINN